MKQAILLSWLLISINASNLNAQSYCGTDLLVEELKNSDPLWYEQYVQANNDWIAYKNQKSITRSAKIASTITTDTSISIPVVVHVLYNTAIQNISEARIRAQIDKLNEDYNRYNADTINTRSVFKPRAGKAKISFYLVNIDNMGEPSNGINRVYTEKSGFDQGFEMKVTDAGGADPWLNGSYCNVWVCNLLDAGLLGYATPPTGSIFFTDGIVVGYETVGGPSAPSVAGMTGRTLTHEMGHWLGLPHIWGPSPTGPGNGTGGSCFDDDNVDDTPFQNSQYWGCPSTNPNTCTELSGTDYPDMYENYMDYVDDYCMNAFTKGQNERMYYSYMVYRSQLGYISAKLQFYNSDNTTCVNFNGISTWPLIWHTGNHDGKMDWKLDTINGYAYFDNYNAPAHYTKDELFTPGYYNDGSGSIIFDFDWAYAKHTTSPSDTLRIWYNTVQGSGIWHLLDEKVGSSLSTTTDIAGIYTPTASEWNHATYIVNTPTDIVSFATQFRFENISAGGNRIFIDNVCAEFSSTVNIDENIFDISIYPNPANNMLWINNFNSHGPFTFQITDITGKIIISDRLDTNTISVEDLSTGVYFFKLKSEDKESKPLKFIKH